MYTIQTNQSGTRTLDISDESLKTIQKYQLLDNLTGSTGFVDEEVLDKLKLHVRSLISADIGECNDLLDLCIDVIYHDNMKALGLQNLIALYNQWIKNQTDAPSDSQDGDEEDALI